MSIDAEIAAERARQEYAAAKNHDIGWCSLADPETPTEYRLAVLAEEFGEIAKELNEIRVGSPGSGIGRLRAELVQVAAVAVAWVEGIDAGWTP